jgi:hypothetical protein
MVLCRLFDFLADHLCLCHLNAVSYTGSSSAFFVFLFNLYDNINFISPFMAFNLQDSSTVNRSGYYAVQRLASYLVELHTASFINQKQADKIIELWADMDDEDKRRVTYRRRFRDKLLTGRFPRSKARHFFAGVESVRRAFLGHGSPAQKPSLSRLVDAICGQLVLKYRRSTTLHTAKGRLLVPKWHKVLDSYSKIKNMIDDNPAIRSGTTLQLFNINLHTLRQW